MNHVLERMSEKSSCCVSFGHVRITDYDFADDSVIFGETTVVLTGVLESLSKGTEPLGLRVPWIKTKVQAFSEILVATTESIPLISENIEIVEKFTYLGSVIHFFLLRTRNQWTTETSLERDEFAR